MTNRAHPSEYADMCKTNWKKFNWKLEILRLQLTEINELMLKY